MNPTANISFARDLSEQLEEWVNDLARPLMPLRTVAENDGTYRLEFDQHILEAVMVGKLVRAV